MRKLTNATAFLLALILLLPACGPANSSGEIDLKGKTISVATTYGPNDGGHETFVSLCAEFSEATGAAITDMSVDATEEWKKEVIAGFETGNEPDVLFFFTGQDVEDLIARDKFVSLDEIRESFPDYASNINLSVLEGMKASNGEGYAVPVKGYWERLYINAEIFEELNLSPPEEFDDLFELTPRLLEGGYIPIAVSLTEVPHYLFEALLFNMTGPSNHHNIPTDPDNVPDSWVKAMEQFSQLYAAGAFPEDSLVPTHADALELFQSKKAAMIVDGDWTAPYIRDSEGTAVINFPAIPGEPRINTDLISGFSMGFYITRKAWDDPEKRDAAAAFVEFITSNSSIMRLNVSGAAMPISISASDKAAQEDNGATPLRESIDRLNENTTAFVGATADGFKLEARVWLFGQILPIAKGEADARQVLSEFIAMNN